MKKINIKYCSKLLFTFIFLIFSSLLISCDEQLEDNSFDVDDVLTVNVSDSEVVLDERFAESTVTINWTTGSNEGTNSSISYFLEIDKAENDFSMPLEYDMGKNQFLFPFDYKTLNQILLNTFNVEPNTTQELEARVTAIFADSSVSSQTASTNFVVTPYLPVTSQLFIVGDATPIGWDISSAIELVPSTTKSGLFTYEGLLSPGNFKFPVNREGCWCQDFYTQDPTDPTRIIHNIAGSGDDIQWEILEGGKYKIEIDLLELTINIEESEDPLFSQIWIVGDASPSGWNVDSPQEFTRTSNPFVFTYEASLVPGDFKIFAGALGDWCGQWYRPLVNGQDLSLTDVEQNSGCEVDNKWTITPENQGRYKITLDTFSNTVKIEKVSLYVVGDGGPAGWDIANPAPFTYDNGVYIFNGELGASNPIGEFKISKFKGNWCDGEWINPATESQSIYDTNFIFTQGCDGPDNKWQLKDGEAGTYEIMIDLEQNIMTITKI